MQVIHITPSTDGYETAKLIANRISRKNSLTAIEINGEQFMTGGFILQDTPKIREVLDAIPKKDQYEFVKSFKVEPFVKFYLEE